MALPLIVGILAGAVVGTRVLERNHLTAALAEGRQHADDAALRSGDALASQRSAAEAQVHNAASNPRLAAAVGGGVDTRTLRDLLDNEVWWERYRWEFPIHALLIKGAKSPLYARGDLLDFDSSALLGEARPAGMAASAIVVGHKAAYLAAVTPLEVAGQGEPPVLLLARPLSGQALEAIAARAGSAVLLTDGSRPIAASGPAVAVAVLHDAIGRERRNGGVFVAADRTWVAHALTVGPELWLWTYAETTLGAPASQRTLFRNKVLLWSGAGLTTLAVLLLGRPRRRRAPAQATAPAPVPNRPPRRRTASGGVPIPVTAADTTRAVAASDATTMGRYLLLDRIGHGGMAEVFTAVTFGVEGFRRRFVIKRLRPELSDNPAAVSQFIDEANLGSNLVHPNIVPVFDFGSTGSAYFLTQEYVPGRDIGQVMRRLATQTQTTLSPELVLWIASEVLHALEYAHNKRDANGEPLGIVHRDVSPENVMLSERGEVKLLDFGVVKANQGRVTQTEVGLVKGSVCFMAPEQARGLAAVDQRADLFSLGLLMYFALTGHTLYEGGSSYDLLVRAANGPSAKEFGLIAALPLPCDDIVSRAVAALPEDRYQSAAEFRAAITPHLEPCGDAITKLVRDLFAGDLAAEAQRIARAVRSEETAYAPAANTKIA